jgi:GT2 family glycosyltransferase
MTGTPPPAGRLAVAIVNRNTRDLLRDCLATVPAHVTAVVIDNASTDGSAAMVATEFPHVHLIASARNPGYGAASNEAIRACAEPYVLLLNSDTLIHEGAVPALAAYLDAHPEVGVAGPRLLNHDGSLHPSCFPFPGTLGWLVENDPVSPLVGLVPPLRRRTLRYAPPERSTAVPWVHGSALAVRRTAFEAVGGFDESFFMYFEEVDLCRRLAAAGWEIHFVHPARVTHLGGASTRQVRTEMAVAHFRSTLHFYRRHYGGLRLAFWVGLMRAKMLARLMRDSALVPLRARADRAALLESVGAWRRALREP